MEASGSAGSCSFTTSYNVTLLQFYDIHKAERFALKRQLYKKNINQSADNPNKILFLWHDTHITVQILLHRTAAEIIWPTLKFDMQADVNTTHVMSPYSSKNK